MPPVLLKGTPDMRLLAAILSRPTVGVCVAICLAASSPGHAQKVDACASDPNVLGVSRIVEVDTKDGPLFGHLQYRDLSFLEPGEVVLTFDDGPLRRHTQPVLDALEAHCTKGIFFMVGRMAVADPEMVKEVARRGHTVGSHTWSHRNLATLSSSRAKGEIELGASAIAKALGKPIAPFFRFPYLSDPKSMISYLQSRDTGVFSIEVDSYDYRTKSAGEVHRKVLAQLKDKGKGIILFHDIQTSTAKDLKGLLDELKRRGYKVVHLVPKGGMTTLAEYDQIADQELSRRKLAQAGKPLANRSIVWPVAPGENEKAASGRPAADPAQELPWATKPPAAPRPVAAGADPAAKTRPSSVPRHRSDEDLTWQERMFDHYR